MSVIDLHGLFRKCVRCTSLTSDFVQTLYAHIYLDCSVSFAIVTRASIIPPQTKFGRIQELSYRLSVCLSVGLSMEMCPVHIFLTQNFFISSEIAYDLRVCRDLEQGLLGKFKATERKCAKFVSGPYYFPVYSIIRSCVTCYTLTEFRPKSLIYHCMPLLIHNNVYLLTYHCMLHVS